MMIMKNDADPTTPPATTGKLIPAISVELLSSGGYNSTETLLVVGICSVPATIARFINRISCIVD